MREGLTREIFFNQSELSVQKFEIGDKFSKFGQFKVC